jgi:hypothetical protein
MNMSLIRVALFALALSSIAAQALVADEVDSVRLAAVFFPAAHEVINR